MAKTKKHCLICPSCGTTKIVESKVTLFHSGDLPNPKDMVCPKCGCQMMPKIN